MAMLLRHGYHDLGLAGLLEATDTPKGSFYHYFKSKEDFALQVIDLYMEGAHLGLDACLGDQSLSPLRRVRRFFELDYRGARYSFGYPACPDLAEQAKLVPLLHPESIGVELSEEFQWHPEQSTAALVAHHPEAKDFAAR